MVTLQHKTKPFEFDNHPFKSNVTSQIQAEQGVSVLLWLALHHIILSCQTYFKLNTGKETLQVQQN